jgi:hypothetical protein
MEEQAIYKDELLEETRNQIEKILEEKGLGLVIAGQFEGDKIKTFIKIIRLKKDETSVDPQSNQ